MDADRERILQQLGRRRAQLQAQQRVVAEAIGRELVALRDAGQLSPAQAARLLGATRRAVYRWMEAADADPPSTDGRG